MGIQYAEVFAVLTFAILCSALPIALARGGPMTRKRTLMQELEKLENDWAAAVETNDPERVGRFFCTSGFVFVGAGGVPQDRKQHLDDFRSGRLKVAAARIEATNVRLYETVAVVGSRCAMSATYNDQDISGMYRLTDMWLRRDGRWHAVAREQTEIRIPAAAQ